MEPSVRNFMDNLLIEQVDKTKFPGVIITGHFTLHGDVKTICNKVSKGWH